MEKSYGAAQVECAVGTEWAEPLEGRYVAVRATRPVAARRGMVSAEWAVGIIAAVAIAGVLLAVVTTGQVKNALLHVILTVIGTFARFAS